MWSCGFLPKSGPNAVDPVQPELIRTNPHHTSADLQDFRKISSHLRDRSVGDCVRFYYRNQKLDEFAALRRKQQLKKRRLQTQEKSSRQYLGARGGAPPQGVLRRVSGAQTRAWVFTGQGVVSYARGC